MKESNDPFEKIAEQLKDLKMPFSTGKYSGMYMRDIPAKKLLELYYTDHFMGAYRMYIVSNLERLKKEAEND